MFGKISIEYSGRKEVDESATELIMTQMRLSTISESLSNLCNLTLLDLSVNHITEIPHCIGQLTNLTKLNLSNN